MYKKLSLLFFILLIIACSHDLSEKETVLQPSYLIYPNDTKIYGSLNNFEYIRQFFTDDTHITLENVDIKTPVVFRGDGSYRFIDKDLQKATISPDGKFEFQIKNIQPGKYRLILHPLTKGGFATLWDLHSKEYVLINFSLQGQIINIVDLGKLSAGKR